MDTANFLNVPLQGSLNLWGTTDSMSIEFHLRRRLVALQTYSELLASISQLLLPRHLFSTRDSLRPELHHTLLNENRGIEAGMGMGMGMG